MGKKPTYEELVNRIKELEREVVDRQFMEKELQESKGKLKAVFDSFPFDVFALDSTSRYFLQNSICKKNWGDFIGKCIENLPVNKETLNMWTNNNRRALSGEIVVDEVEYQSLEGKKCFYHNIFAPIRDEEKICGILGVLVDISDRKQLEESLKTSLKVKQMLLSEIHHRVKNNLEIISSLIDLSSINTENREKQKLLSDVRSRIYSMSLIHNQLYKSDRFDQVDMERHVQEMMDSISTIYGSSETLINFVIEASEMYLSLNQAIPSALALNEIITNSFKHAFKERKQGTINICINNPADDKIFMRVKDDGVGISKGLEFNNTKGIGLKLVKHLIEDQLKGEIRVNCNDGTEICLEFKKLKL